MTNLAVFSEQYQADMAEIRKYLDDPRSLVETCADCGGKYRPAGGPCIHEHPAPDRHVEFTAADHDEYVAQIQVLVARYGAVAVDELCHDGNCATLLRCTLDPRP